MRARYGFAGCLALSLSAPRTAFADEGTPIGVDPSTAPPAAPTVEPSPYTSSSPPAAAPPEYVAKPAPEQSWPQRQGFTLEVGLGPSFTAMGSRSGYDGGLGITPASITVGGFVSSRVALGARASGTGFFQKFRSTTSQINGLTLNGSVERTYYINNYFLGPHIQVFVTDHVFLAGGAGFGVIGPSVFFNDRNDGLPDAKVGFAMTARAGFAFFARRHHWLGVVIEATPGFYGRDTALGMASLLEWQYY